MENPTITSRKKYLKVYGLSICTLSNYIKIQKFSFMNLFYPYLEIKYRFRGNTCKSLNFLPD